MGTREDLRPCAMCATELRGGTAYLVDGVRLGRRRRGAARFTRLLICETCYKRGSPDPDTGLTRAVSARRTKTAEWWGLAGRGPALPPQACLAGCGLTVVRGAEVLMRGVTCSAACRTSLTRTRNGGRGSGRPCGACGTPVTAGRADSAYCDAACRQKAYRRRTAARTPNPTPNPNPTPTPNPRPSPALASTSTSTSAPGPAPAPVPELLAALIPFVNGTTLGISQTLYKTLYRVHVAHLRGHDPAEHIAKLASLNPDRIKIPDTADGHRLRASLRTLRPAQNPHPQS
ncbi:hypothetical protein [Streptomyces anulatus]|uniref:Uncharacterized protein n=1 Tax=Streptomyces anulatus TaxID=1892 RepID=A0A7K3RIS2_STRAQ|nr:hypothetical protein [Streptomyces anulatus]NEC02053.1 hypothetical protein [Streptomyces anulatus]NED27378.1 hypothetical protein [Streptomyces anulatus]